MERGRGFGPAPFQYVTTMSSAADRNKRYRARLRDGLVRLEIETDRLWLAEALAAGGYIASADQDDKQTLDAAAARLIARIIDFARKAGRVPRELHADEYLPDDNNDDEGSCSP